MVLCVFKAHLIDKTHEWVTYYTGYFTFCACLVSQEDVKTTLYWLFFLALLEVTAFAFRSRLRHKTPLSPQWHLRGLMSDLCAKTSVSQLLLCHSFNLIHKGTQVTLWGVTHPFESLLSHTPCASHHYSSFTVAHYRNSLFCLSLGVVRRNR